MAEATLLEELRALSPEAIRALAELADQKLTQDLVVRAREDPNVFVEYVMEMEGGGRMKQTPFHRQWQRALSGLRGSTHNPYGRVGITAFRSAGKTQQESAVMLRQLGLHPNIRMKIVAGRGDHAQKCLRYVRTAVEENERYHAVFPDVKPGTPWGAEKIAVLGHHERDANLEAWTIFGQGAGSRTDYLFGDDVVTESNSIIKPAMQKKVIDTWFQTWMYTLARHKAIEYGNRVGYLATTWTTADLSSLLKTNSDYAKTFFNLPVLTEEGESAWPEMWTLADIEHERRNSPNPMYFECQMMMNPINDQLRLFDNDTIDVGRALGVELGVPWGSKEYAEFVNEGMKVIGVDLAISTGKEGSYTVIFVWSVIGDVMWPVEIIRIRTRKRSEIIGRILQMMEKHNPLSIMVESNSFQRWMVEGLQEIDAFIPVRCVVTGRQKADPLIGVPPVQGSMSNGRMGIPMTSPPGHAIECNCPLCMAHPPNCQCDFCSWLVELSQYGIMGHSDTVMAMWFAWLAAGHGRRHGNRAMPRTYTNEQLKKLETTCQVDECFGSYKPSSITGSVLWSCDVCGHSVESPGRARYSNLSPIADADPFEAAILGVLMSRKPRPRRNVHG